LTTMTDLPKHVAENIDRFTGRTWLLPRILEWLNHSNERFFLLTGAPGTGKSMILAWLAGFGPEPKDASAREQLNRLRKAVKAAHFCHLVAWDIEAGLHEVVYDESDNWGVIQDWRNQ